MLPKYDSQHKVITSKINTASPSLPIFFDEKNITCEIKGTNFSNSVMKHTGDVQMEKRRMKLIFILTRDSDIVTGVTVLNNVEPQIGKIKV